MIKSFEEINTQLTPESVDAWVKLVGHIRVYYKMDELWDGKDELKFRCAGKTFVTLYLRKGYFTVLLIYGKAEREVFEAEANTYPTVLRNLFETSHTYHDGKWMSLDVQDSSVIPDLIRMLTIKKKPNRKMENLKNAFVGCCGNRCDQCLLYVENGGIESRKLFAEGDHKCYWHEDEPMNDYTNMICPGCHDDCSVRQCAKDKGYALCIECAEYPCSVVTNAFTSPGRCNMGLTAEDVTLFVLPYSGRERFERCRNTLPGKKAENKKADPVEEYLSQIPAEYTALFRALADHAISLGYRPIRCRTAVLNIDFRSSKAKRTIMKFTLEEEKHDSFGYGEQKLPGLRMRFFAANEYSDIFHNAVQYVIERFNGKYTGCYGCGRCQGEPQGYHYTYPDGRQVFRCGGELLSIFDFNYTDLDEMKKLLNIQAEYDYKNIVKRG